MKPPTVILLGLIAACGLAGADAQPSSDNANSSASQIGLVFSPNADLDARLNEAGNFIRALQGSRQAAIPSWALTRARAIIIFTPASDAASGQSVALLRMGEGRYGAPIFYKTLDRRPVSADAAAQGGAPVVALLMSSRALGMLTKDSNTAGNGEMQVVANVRTGVPELRHQQADIMVYQSSSEIDIGATLAALNTQPDDPANKRYYNEETPPKPEEISVKTGGLSPSAQRLMAVVNQSAAALRESDEELVAYFQPPREYFQAPSAYFRRPSEYFQTK